jgi:crossover junction endodeoxyribonuclease RuvC
MPRTRRRPTVEPAPILPPVGLHPSEVVVVGIDPGGKGGVAAILGRRLLWCRPIPTITYDGADWCDAVTLARWLNVCYHDEPGADWLHVLIERAHGFTGDSSGSAFRFGSFYGAALAGAVQNHAVSGVHPINPRDWQKLLLPGVKGRDNLKAASCERARRRWPGVDLFPGRRTTPHDGMADALNLAEYGQALLCGTLAAFDHPPEATVRQRHRAR